MQILEIPLKAEGSAEDSRMIVYLLDTPGDSIRIQKRPAIILCPGGGYERTSYREGEPLATYFLNQGYHVGILRYSTAPARYPTALLELGTAMKLFCEHADVWKVEKEHIFVQGSSAGGHLAACLGVFWQERFLAERLGVNNDVLRPKGLVLSYPVISSDESISHRGSFKNLLGERYEEEKEALSLERQAGSHVPPCFIWHTGADQTVPVENSILFALALRKQRIPFEMHIFQDGMHGLGPATELVRKPNGLGVQKECQCWMELADVWMKNLIKEEC